MMRASLTETAPRTIQTPSPDAAPARLWTRDFTLLNVQFMVVTSVTALFFQFQAYLGVLGLSPGNAGLVIGADALASLALQPLLSVFVHTGNARRVLAAGSLVFALALALEARGSGFLPLLAARLLQGVGFSGLVAALVALIVVAIPPGMSGRAFGWVSLMRLLPYAAVPPLLDRLGVRPASFGTVLVLGSALALVPAMLLPFARPGEGATATSPPGFAGFRESLRSRPVVLLLVAGLLLNAGYAAAFFYMHGLAAALGEAGRGGAFFSLATAAMILVRAAGSGLFDRWNKVWLSLAGYALVAAGYVLLPQLPPAFLFLGPVVGLGWGIVMPLQAALMFDVSSPGSRALNQNLLLATLQAGFFLGPVLGGVLLAHGGFAALFAVAAAATVAAALSTAAVRLASPPR